jgi:hypothetical protein
LVPRLLSGRTRPMTLDEYQLRVLERLRACQDPNQARTLLTEVEGVLTASLMSDHTLRVFWRTLNGALERLEQESAPLERRQLAVLSAVIASAQAVIADFQAQVVSDEPAKSSSKASS